MFIGREKEFSEMNRRYAEKNFQLLILYGRRRVGKTTLLKEFCREKNHIFYSAEQSNEKLNLEKFLRRFFGITVKLLWNHSGHGKRLCPI